LNYDLYYVHDGNLEAGHKHDWEGVTIIFAKDPAANGGDWWVLYDFLSPAFWERLPYLTLT